MGASPACFFFKGERERRMPRWISRLDKAGRERERERKMLLLVSDAAVNPTHFFSLAVGAMARR